MQYIHISLYLYIVETYSNLQYRLSSLLHQSQTQQKNEVNCLNILQHINQVLQQYIQQISMLSIFKVSQLSWVASKTALRRMYPMFTFSTGTPLKIQSFKFSKKHEWPVESLSQHFEAIVMSRCCDTMAALIRDNCQKWTDEHVKVFYQHMRDIRMDLNHHFHNVISPFSIEYLKQFNRDQATTMYEMLRTFVELDIENKPLLDALIQKLDTENCYKYIPLTQTGYLLQAILSHPKHQAALNSLTRKLITVTYQQRTYYNSFKQTRSLIARVLNKLEGLKLDDLKLEDVDVIKKLK